MTAERMYDLSFEFLDDGTLRLEQSSGCGETVLVDLHPAQLRLLCERANLTKPTALLLDRLEAGHVRRLRTHLERIQRLVDDDTFFNDLFDRMPDGVEWWKDIQAIHEQAEELVADLGPEGISCNGGGHAPGSNDKSPPAISVTQTDKPKRGRPSTGDAMTNSERQQRHRDKASQGQFSEFAQSAETKPVVGEGE